MPLVISFAKFQAMVWDVYPDAQGQIYPIAPDVHIFDEDWFQNEFWPKWTETVRAINEQLKNEPLQNNAQRGLCDEINKRLVVELTQATRQTHGNANVGPGVFEATVVIPAGYALNLVPAGVHRAAIIGLTKDGKTVKLKFGESQLKYAQYQVTPLSIAKSAGVELPEFWV